MPAHFEASAFSAGRYEASFALPGDYNHDGTVDNADYDVWRQNIGSASADADGDRSGLVDAADYVVWRRNVGRTLPGTLQGVGAGVASIPEPSTSVFAAFTLAFLLLWSRRVD
jgi:hypothetical protein